MLFNTIVRWLSDVTFKYIYSRITIIQKRVFRSKVFIYMLQQKKVYSCTHTVILRICEERWDFYIISRVFLGMINPVHNILTPGCLLFVRNEQKFNNMLIWRWKAVEVQQDICSFFFTHEWLFDISAIFGCKLYFISSNTRVLFNNFEDDEK